MQTTTVMDEYGQVRSSHSFIKLCVPGAVFPDGEAFSSSDDSIGMLFSNPCESAE